MVTKDGRGGSRKQARKGQRRGKGGAKRVKFWLPAVAFSALCSLLASCQHEKIENVLTSLEDRLGGGASPTQQQAEKPLPEARGGEQVACRVIAVTDGDTFTCDMDGNGRYDPPLEKIRMIGVNAPETKRSPKNKTGQDEPYSLEAKAWLRKTLLDQDVVLRFDRERVDRYGRSLAYVYFPGVAESVNERYAATGLVKPMFFRPNFALKEAIVGQMTRAYERRLNLWGDPSERALFEDKYLTPAVDRRRARR